MLGTNHAVRFLDVNQGKLIERETTLVLTKEPTFRKALQTIRRNFPMAYVVTRINGRDMTGEIGKLADQDCPACSGPSNARTDLGGAIFECSTCGAIHGNVPEGTPLPLLSGKWEAPEVANTIAAPKYFDFCVVRGMIRMIRTHGWFNPATGHFIQIG